MIDQKRDSGFLRGWRVWSFMFYTGIGGTRAEEMNFRDGAVEVEECPEWNRVVHVN
jgi:hypothetical protein